MATQAQVLANRRNTLKSTGPRTPHGKVAVSQNAVKHALSARYAVISSESRPDFELHRDRLLAELAPVGPMESLLAERIVSLSWRLQRAGLIQNQAIDAMHADNTSGPLARLAKSISFGVLDRPQCPTLDSHGDLALGRIALKDFSNARVFDRLLMYERRIEHSLYKTILELQRLLLIRNLDPLNPPDDQTPYPALFAKGF